MFSTFKLHNCTNIFTKINPENANTTFVIIRAVYGAYAFFKALLPIAIVSFGSSQRGLSEELFIVLWVWDALLTLQTHLSPSQIFTTSHIVVASFRIRWEWGPGWSPSPMLEVISGLLLCTRTPAVARSPMTFLRYPVVSFQTTSPPNSWWLVSLS